MYRSISIVVVMFFCTLCAGAQVFDSLGNRPDKIAVGVGAGYDFGGYGGNVTYYPQRSIGIFGGVGYALAGVGYNAGVKLRLLTAKSPTTIVPFIMGMYGYYAAAAPKDYSVYNKLFYGFTAGAGVDYRPAHSKFGYFTGTILIPFRTQDAQRYIDYINLARSLGYHNKLRGYSASIGYKFILFR